MKPRTSKFFVAGGLCGMALVTAFKIGQEVQGLIHLLDEINADFLESKHTEDLASQENQAGARYSLTQEVEEYLRKCAQELKDLGDIRCDPSPIPVEFPPSLTGHNPAACHGFPVYLGNRQIGDVPGAGWTR